MKSSNYNRSLTLLKSGILIIALKDLVFYFLLNDFLLGENSIIPLEVFTGILTHYHIDFLDFLFRDSFTSKVVPLLGIVTLLLFAFNYKNLITGLLLFFILLLIKWRNLFIMDGGDNLYALIIFFLAFFDPNAREEDNSSISSSQVALCLKLQLCLVYFFAGIWKLKGNLWLNGTSLHYLLQVQDFNVGNLGDIVSNNPYMYIPMTYFTVAFEIIFPVLIWTNKYKYYVMALGLLLHVGIFFMLRIDNFSAIMLLLYLSFISNKEIELIKHKMRKIKHFTRYELTNKKTWQS